VGEREGERREKIRGERGERGKRESSLNV